jgi:cyclopropane fatty-acyl-phospholipid synthase-like methyltransferase
VRDDVVDCRGRGIEGETGRSSEALTYDGLIFDRVIRDYYGNSRAYNVGYWDMGARTQAEASHDLLTHLLSRIDRPVERILDVACGLGETTGYLKRQWPQAAVTGINFSAQQIAACREFQPDCRFEVMDAAALEFPEGMFDLVVCVEAPMHFLTRAAFLGEAHRVLSPGGRLAMSDMLFTATEWLAAWHVPRVNHIPDMAGYREILIAAGLTDVVVEDINEMSWKGFCRNMRSWLEAPGQQNPDAEGVRQWKENLQSLEGAIAHYLVSWATKPTNTTLLFGATE